MSRNPDSERLREGRLRGQPLPDLRHSERVRISHPGHTGKRTRSDPHHYYFSCDFATSGPSAQLSNPESPSGDIVF